MDDDEDLGPVIEDAGEEHAGEYESLGSRMLERDSYDVTIDGLRESAEGAAHLMVRREDPSWGSVVTILDRIRLSVVKTGGLEMVSKEQQTREPEGAMVMSMLQAYERLFEGLKKAERGCRQLAVCHRMDLRWSMYATQFEKMRDNCSKLVRKKRINEAVRSLH